MANIDRPQGLVYSRSLDGSTCSPAREYSVDVANATAIFVGDPVRQEADGNVTAAGAGGDAIGAVTGVKGDYDNLSRRHLPATTVGTVFVIDDPQALFLIQEDDGGTALTSAARGGLTDFIATAGDPTSGISRYELDQDAVAAASGTVRLIGLVEKPGNNYGDNAEWEVQINEHQLLNAAGI